MTCSTLTCRKHSWKKYLVFARSPGYSPIMRLVSMSCLVLFGRIPGMWVFLWGISIFISGCTAVQLKMTPRGNERQLILEKELALHCHAPPTTPPLQKLAIFSECRDFLSLVVPFDESFDTSPLRRKRKEKLLQDLTEIAMATFEWPKDNRLLAFPGIEFPKKMLCDFAPETNPTTCQESPKHPRNSTLGQRLVSHILSKNYPLFYVQNVEAVENLTFENFDLVHRDATARIWSRGYNVKAELGVYLLEAFWHNDPLGKLGVLLHEIGHTESLHNGHVPCPRNPKVVACDDSLDNEVEAFRVLTKEIHIRQRVQTYKEHLRMSPEDTKDLKRRKPPIYWAIEGQCNTLKKIVHLPVLLPNVNSHRCFAWLESAEKYIQ